MSIQPHSLTLLALASVLFAGCDGEAVADGGPSLSGFPGEWTFISGTVQEACVFHPSPGDGGTSSTSLEGGTETFVATSGGGLDLFEGALPGYPQMSPLGLSLDGGTAETGRYYRDLSREGASVEWADPLRFEMSSDQTTLSLTGSYGHGGLYRSCSSTVSGVLQKQ